MEVRLFAVNGNTEFSRLIHPSDGQELESLWSQFKEDVPFQNWDFEFELQHGFASDNSDLDECSTMLQNLE